MAVYCNNLLDHLNKRFTLNLLIQGAASHTYLTAHHLVRYELDTIDRRLVRLYDKMALNVHLSQWMGDLVFAVGFPKRFWANIDKPDHPFARHPFLAKHGPRLAADAKRNTMQRAREKGVSTVPGIQYGQTFWLLMRTLLKERQRHRQLEALAIKATCQIWGIDANRLTGTITNSVEFGNLQTPTTRGGRILRSAAAGYGGVRRVNGQFHVVARAWMWPLLAHELTKGTAELVCLHGFNEIDDNTWKYITDEADRIEHEIWMMQAGGELWRLFLNAIPNELPMPEALMHVARMEPEPLEQLMMDLVEHPLTARGTIADFMDDYEV